MQTLPLHILSAIMFLVGFLLMFILIRFRPKTFYFYFPLLLCFINGFLFSLVITIDMLDGVIINPHIYNIWSSVLRLQIVMTILILLCLEYKKQFNGTAKNIIRNVIKAIKGVENE